MKDKNGHTFEDLREIQRAHIDSWHDKLLLRLISKIEEYCLQTNLPATDEKQTHRVYRGQDLVQIIMDWPDLKPCYVQPSKPEDPRADI